MGLDCSVRTHISVEDLFKELRGGNEFDRRVEFGRLAETRPWFRETLENEPLTEGGDNGEGVQGIRHGKGEITWVRSRLSCICAPSVLMNESSSFPAATITLLHSYLSLPKASTCYLP